MKWKICGLIASLLVCSVSSFAQEHGRIFPYKWPSGFPHDEITTADVQQALAWAGHYDGMADGGYGPYTRRAVERWLSAKGFPKSDTLSASQAAQLVAEGLQQRDRYGWSNLVDDAIGFSVGIPSAFSTLQSPSRSDQALMYFAPGRVSVNVAVRPQPNACTDMENLYNGLLNSKDVRPDYKARKDDWFVVAGDDPAGHFYLRAQCRQDAIVVAVMKMANGEDLSFLYVAFSNSLSLRPVLNPYATPAPRIVPPGLRSYAASSTPPVPAFSTAPQIPSSSSAPQIDRSGKTNSLSLVLFGGKELRPQDLFSRASEAVYVVETPQALGSAVAISERELLTNCHVVKGSPVVQIIRGGNKHLATVTSANTAADRCVLRANTNLPAWAKVRPYADVKIGERVYTIGAPKGLELTLAEGIVSSKRNMDDGRYIQTSAPISMGSSGGGLFDTESNLIGITTFMLRDSQNLNFAIAAEEYAK